MDHGKAPQASFSSNAVVEDGSFKKPHVVGVSLPVNLTRGLCDADGEESTKRDMENHPEGERSRNEEEVLGDEPEINFDAERGHGRAQEDDLDGYVNADDGRGHFSTGESRVCLRRSADLDAPTPCSEKSERDSLTLQASQSNALDMILLLDTRHSLGGATPIIRMISGAYRASDLSATILSRAKYS